MRRLEAEYTLYLDVIFLQNFFMDFLLLVLTGRIMRQTFSAAHCAQGAAAGALWACGVIFMPFSFPVKMAVTCGPVSLLMVFLAFREKSPLRLLRQASGLYMTAVLMAGGLELLKNLGARMYSFENPADTRQQKLPFYVLFFGAGAVFFFLCFVTETVGKERRRRSHTASVTLCFKEKEIKIRAFLDTGNSLREPVSGRPVSVVWAKAVKELFEGASGVLMVPYRSVGKEKGLLPAVKADCIYIEMDGTCRQMKHPLLAVSKLPLSSDGSFEMLLHEEMWENAEEIKRKETDRKDELGRDKNEREKSQDDSGDTVYKNGRSKEPENQ